MWWYIYFFNIVIYKICLVRHEWIQWKESVRKKNKEKRKKIEIYKYTQ
jgi:hypothetical protein